jgi:hypothetical protein
MPGDPTAALLDQARLTAASCTGLQDDVEARVARMRAEVQSELRRWHEEQPDCWAADREREAERRAEEACMAHGQCGSGLGLSGIGEGGGGIGVGISMGIGSAAAPMVTGHASRGRVVRASSSFSRTNNQVASVDEADIVKTDGKYVYLVANGALRIVEALDPRVVSVTRLPGDIRDLFVEGDRAVVFTASAPGTPRCTYGYDCVVAGDGTTTQVHVLDVSDRRAPKKMRRIDLSGSLIAARRVGNTVHAVVADGDTLTKEYETWPDGLDRCGVAEAVVRARVARLVKENERRLRASVALPTMVDRGVATPLCAGLLEAKDDTSHTFTTVVSFDMTDDQRAATTATVRSRPGAVFASEDALYVSAWRKPGQPAFHPLYGDTAEVTEIHKFRLGAHPADTRYVGSGAVPGHVLNQLSLDQWNGYLRVASTRGRVPDPAVESVVSVLAEGEGGDLVRVGAVDHLAPGEDIRAVRFDDDRGYVVTFKKTDPLFVLDLRDGAHPAVLGELKIPGFSTYLHRLDPTHLLSIGFDAVDHGSFAYFDGLLLQLFDVTDPTDPKLLHREKLGTRGSSSEAATDHLAFNYFPERGLLAIPATVCENGGDGVAGSVKAFSGLAVYKVDTRDGFTPVGRVDHGRRGATCGQWWSASRSVVKRSLFVDDLVYSMASDRLKVQRLGAMGRDVADIPLGK